jgi:hypothetical protein
MCGRYYCFLNAKICSSGGNSRVVCDEGALNLGNVRKWFRLFKEGTTNRDHAPPPVQTR